MQIKDIAISTLEDMKAIDLVCLDVGEMTSLADHMVVASGTSKRHVSSIAEKLIMQAKKAQYPPLGVEGLAHGDWVCVDFGDIVVHVMIPETRQLYDLERLWTTRPDDEGSDDESPGGESSDDESSASSLDG